MVPLVAEINRDGVAYYRIRKMERIGEVSAIATNENRLLEQIYALKIKDDDFRPRFRKGSIIYFQKNVSPEQFVDGDYLIYCRENDHGSFRELEFANEHLILKDLSLSHKDLVIPPEHLKSCDKAIYIRFS